MMIDLRKTFDNLMRDAGHQILLQRRSLDDTDNPHPQKIWADQLEKHTVRHRYGRNTGLPNVLTTAPEGQIHDADMVYYFRYDADPREGDRIYEMDSRFKEKLATLLISFAIPMRGKNGRVEYWVAGTVREQPQ